MVKYVLIKVFLSRLLKAVGKKLMVQTPGYFILKRNDTMIYNMSKVFIVFIM